MSSCAKSEAQFSGVEAGGDWRAALDILREVGALAHLDAIASRQPIRIACRPQDDAFLRDSLPHALSPIEAARLAPGACVTLDCFPLNDSAPRRAGAPPPPRLGADGLALFLTHGDRLPAERPAPLSRRRYYLFSTPRSGSTYLSALLSSSGALGTPGEFIKDWLKPYLAASGLGLPALFDLLHGYSQSDNGVFGAKTIINDLFALLPEHDEAYFSEIRDKPCYLLVRGDKAAQALSNVRANSLSLYHVYAADLDAAAARLRDFRASVADLFEKERWLLRQEADFIELARSRGVRLRLISYEALAQSRQAARLIVDDIAADLGVTETLRPPSTDLVKIQALSGDDGLDAYRAFRRGAVLCSTRSEPHLGLALGQGWGRVEAWGANALAEARELEIVAPRGVRAQAVELLLAFEGRRPPAALAADGAPVAIRDPDARPAHWRLLAPMGETQKLRLTLDAGLVKIQEAVFHRTPPDETAPDGAPTLSPA